MTFDLEAAKRLAQQLAGDVLSQIEKDGSINRENIAGQLLAGLVLEAAHAVKGNVEKRAGLGGEEYPLTVAKSPLTEYRVITSRPGEGFVHLVCCCDECKRRRKLSLCGCEMCAHHSEAAAIMADAEKGVSCTAAEAQAIVDRRGAWNAQKEYLAKIAQRRAIREMYVQDVQTVTVKLWRMENGERVPVEATDDIIQAWRGAIEDNSPHELMNPDQVVFPNGRVMSGLELASIGYSADFLWSETKRRDLATPPRVKS
jgi:hypothetical protein